MLKSLLAQLLRRPTRSLADHQRLAAAELGGESYLALLARLHAYLQPRTYVEIGVSTGSSLVLAGAETEALGIDPAPRLEHVLGPRMRVFAETSDAFFAGRDLRAQLGGRAVELAFIDGMHLFEFALRDFMNLERHCSRQGAILLHDCYPLDEATASRERRTVFWSGDVWRALLALKKYRPELRIALLAAPPSGLAVLRGLDPGSRVLAERYDEIVADLKSVPYGALEGRKAEMLNLVPGDWETARSLFTRI
jgi:methyltransferase family protein